MEEIIAGAGFFLELWMIQIYAAMVFRTKFCFRPFSCFLFVWNEIAAVAVNFGSCPAIVLWTTHLFLVLYFCRRFRRKWKENVVRFGIVILLTGITQIFAALLELTANAVIGFGGWRFVVVNAVGLSIAVGSYLAVKNKIILQDDKINSLYQLSLVCIAPMLIMILDYYEDHEIKLLYDIVIFVIIAVVFMYFNKVQKIESRLQQRESEYELRDVYGKIYKEAIADMRRRQHSYKNQILAIRSTYMSAQSVEEITRAQEKYCAAIEDDGRYDAILTKCNDAVMAGFLYYKCKACEKQGVRICYDIKLDEVKCLVMLHEIVEITGILLDNACEKVLGFPDGERFVSLYFTEQSEKIVLETANRSEVVPSKEIELMFVEGYSTKGEGRGLGLVRMKHIVDSYKLEIQVENRASGYGNLLVFRIIIPK